MSQKCRAEQSEKSYLAKELLAESRNLSIQKGGKAQDDARGAIRLTSRHFNAIGNIIDSFACPLYWIMT